jgi:hypothetical protein
MRFRSIRPAAMGQAIAGQPQPVVRELVQTPGEESADERVREWSGAHS